MSSISHQRLPKHEVSLIDLKHHSSIVVAYIKIGREPWPRESPLHPFTAQLILELPGLIRIQLLL